MAAVPYAQFLAQVAAPGFKPAPVTAVAGAEAFMRRDALAALRHRLEAMGFTWERLDPDEITPGDLTGRLRSSSLFGDRSALVLKSVKRGNRQEAILRFKDDLLAYLDKPSDSNLLVLDGETWNGTYAVPKRIKKDYLTVECEAFKPWESGEVERFLETLAQRHSLRLGRGAAARLREACGGDIGLCSTELEKLALVTQGTVEVATLEQHLHHRGADHALELCDAILRGDTKQAAELGKSLFVSEDPGDALQFLGLVESQLRKLAKLSWAIQEPGANDMSALGKAGFNPRAPNARTMVQKARALDSRGLNDAFRLLLDADREMKGAGSLQPGMVMLVLSLRLAEALTGKPAGRRAG